MDISGEDGGNSNVFSIEDVKLDVDGFSFGYVLPHGKYMVKPRNVIMKPNRSSFRSLILYTEIGKQNKLSFCRFVR